MLLLEAHGKKVLADAGLPLPRSTFIRAGETPRWPVGAAACVVKAQVPVGGRGKAGGILRATPEVLQAQVQAVLAARIKGHAPQAVLIEEVVQGSEHYLSIIVDANAGALRLMYSPQGGIEIEEAFEGGAGSVNLLAAPTPEGLAAAVAQLRAAVAAETCDALAEVAQRLATCVLDNGLLLAEINPLFIDAQGRPWVGDAKLVVDMNIVAEHSAQRALFDANRDLYPDAWRKINEDFDYVEIDRQGDIGLVTTGAGLSMMLIDELVAHGARPINFCDIRTGQMRGRPDRLVSVLGWLGQISTLRVVLVNVFAGVTDLGEFARLLLEARRLCPTVAVPFVARLVGHNAAQAEALIRAAPCGIEWEPDLERAVARAVAIVGNG